MIRFIHLIRRKPELSKLEFRRKWHGGEFDELLIRIATALGSARVEKSLVLDVSLNRELQAARGSEDDPYDALLEHWIADARNLEEVLESAELQEVLNEMEDMQFDFVDFRHSQRFFLECNPPLIGEGAEDKPL